MTANGNANCGASEICTSRATSTQRLNSCLALSRWKHHRSPPHVGERVIVGRLQGTFDSDLSRFSLAGRGITDSQAFDGEKHVVNVASTVVGRTHYYLDERLSSLSGAPI